MIHEILFMKIIRFIIMRKVSITVTDVDFTQLYVSMWDPLMEVISLGH